MILVGGCLMLVILVVLVSTACDMAWGAPEFGYDVYDSC